MAHSQQHKLLLDPITLGDLNLKNKIIVAPLTRMRGDKDGNATDLMVEYYTQRHEYGLIITECS
jgi:N-ethylmaleimide reductase